MRLIAFYLPQFHPIPENDEWWGEGFTEWNNVERARPLFRGHQQPTYPGELGYYDLRNPETRERQVELARQHAVSAFCYFHYWFEGKRLLGLPLDRLLRTGKPDFPFCLCWANESWTRAWDAATGDVLIEQRYSEEDDRRHFRWLASVFRDDRYVRVGGKPLFLVYRASTLPDPRATTDTWRDEAQRLGIGELHLARVESSRHEHTDPAELGFDAAVEFQPDWSNVPPPLRSSLLWRGLRRLGLVSQVWAENRIAEYPELVARALAKSHPGYVRYPCVTPSWDNSPRRRHGGAFILTGATPARYERWLMETMERAAISQGSDPLVFVNAWNEWAEGNILEPTTRWGRAYLEATLRASERACAHGSPTSPASRSYPTGKTGSPQGHSG
jgi:lipopolysaccharide biosynthesis protein